jgi:hypothetical protein
MKVIILWARVKDLTVEEAAERGLYPNTGHFGILLDLGKVLCHHPKFP